MKNKAVPIIVVFVIILAAMGFFAFRTLSSFQEEAKKQKESSTANTYVVDEGDVISEVVETGPLEAFRVVEVKSRVQGRVKELLVDEGDFVTQGQLVAVIDPQETQLQVRQNQAQLRGAQASVDRLDVDIRQRRITAAASLERAKSRLRQLDMEVKEQPNLTTASIKTAESSLSAAQQSLDLLVRVTQPNTKVQVQTSLDEAKSNLTNARLDFDRRKALLEKGYISRREFEQAELSIQLAEARVKTAQERVENLDREQALERSQAQERIKQATQELARARSGKIQDTVKVEERRQAVQNLRDAEAALKDIDGLLANRRQQEATVDQLDSVLTDAMRQLGETEIRSPVSGIVSKRLVQLGELVASLSSFSSGSPIFRIEDRTAMKVRLNINEIDVAKLKLGTAAEIRVDAYPDKKYTGRVSKIAPSSNEAAAGTGGAAAQGADPVVKYAVEVTLDTAPPELKSGMSALCRMIIAGMKSTLRVRRDFVGTNEDKTYFVEVITDEKKLDKDKKPEVKKTIVRLGPSSGAYVAVLSGVKKGDKIWKPKFSGPPRKTFFQDGDEAQRAEEKKKEDEEIKKRSEEQGSDGS